MHTHTFFKIGIQLINSTRCINITATWWHLSQQYRDIWTTLRMYICYQLLILFNYFVHRVMFTIISTTHHNNIFRRFVWVDKRADPTAEKRDGGIAVYIAWGRDTKFVQPASNVLDQGTTNHDRLALIGLWSRVSDVSDDRRRPSVSTGERCPTGWLVRAAGADMAVVLRRWVVAGTVRIWKVWHAVPLDGIEVEPWTSGRVNGCRAATAEYVPRWVMMSFWPCLGGKTLIWRPLRTGWKESSSSSIAVNIEDAIVTICSGRLLNFALVIPKQNSSETHSLTISLVSCDLSQALTDLFVTSMNFRIPRNCDNSCWKLSFSFLSFLYFKIFAICQPFS